MAGRRKLDNVKIRASLNVKCTHCDEERHLPKGEIELVKPNRIIVHAAITVLLIVDCYATPVRAARRFVNVQGMSYSIQSDGLVQQAPVRRSLHLYYHMVPRIILWVAGSASRHPFLIHIVIYIPLVSASNSALVSPNESLPLGELVNIKLKSLGIGNILGVEINVIDEVVGIVGQCIAVIWQPLRGERPYEVIIPENIRIRPRASDTVQYGGGSAECRRRNSRRP